MKQNPVILFALCMLCTMIISCSAPTYITADLLPEPEVYQQEIRNTCYFGIQNMDEKAKVENKGLVCHYNGFDVQYKVLNDFVISMTIINNSNKSLIIDKSKSYVLYDGYSSQLFKDVRSSRSTTFNNVQDAINNVQTNEGGVLMTIPPYAKWEMPLIETNVRSITKLPDFIKEVGPHSLSAFDNKEVVEFVIPYSYDYAMAKWSTCRNRVFVSSVNVEYRNVKVEHSVANAGQARRIDDNSYVVVVLESPDYTEYNKVHAANMQEANRVDEINWKRYVKHRRKVGASHTFWGIIAAAPTLFIGSAVITSRGCDHMPPKYGDTPQRKAPFDEFYWN